MKSVASYHTFVSLFCEQHFQKPMQHVCQQRSSPGAELPSPNDVKELFSVIKTIQGLNSEFLKALEKLLPFIESRDDFQLQLGPAFSQVSRSFRFYSAYINYYDKR